MPYSCFQTDVLAKFVDTICIFFYTHSPYFICHCTEYELYQRSELGYRRNIHNAMTQHFITAKISGCALKQGSKHTHHYVRAINNCKIRLRKCRVECEQSSVGVWLDWLVHTPACKIESC